MKNSPEKIQSLTIQMYFETYFRYFQVLCSLPQHGCVYVDGDEDSRKNSRGINVITLECKINSSSQSHHHKTLCFDC